MATPVNSRVGGLFIAAIAAGTPLAGLAQENNAAGTVLEKVTVTGSAIPRTQTETASPVQIITRADIDRSGLTTTADVVRSISADNSGTLPTAFGNAFAAGASGVALRGLTVNSTLVLIDGRRTASYPVGDDGERAFVDLNTIPLNAVERIEVLKDGASSLYGADAIAGVVNIILKSHYEGREVTGEIGTSQHGGGTMRRLEGTFGSGSLMGNRANGYVTFEYEKDDRISVPQREFPYNTNNLSSLGGLNLIGGQPGLNSGSIYGSVTPGTATGGNILFGVPNGGAVAQPLNACGPQALAQVTDSTGTYCTQNLTSYGDDQPAQERYGMNARFSLKIDDNTTAYLNGWFYENRVVVDEAPNQIQNSVQVNTNSIALPPTLLNGQPNPNDPFASSGEYALINYAFGDINAANRYTTQSFRLTGGLKGQWQGWDYDTAVVFSHMNLHSSEAGFILYNQLVSDIENGTYNFNHSLGPNSSTVLNALSPTYDFNSTSDLDMVDFRASRSLWTLPGGPLGIAVGTEYRYEQIIQPPINPNREYQGLGIAETNGQHDVSGTYVELDAPVIPTVEINVSGRYDHYTDFADHGITPKAGIKWTPIEQVALRGTFSEGFRAPSFAETAGENEGFVGYNPPAAFVAAHGNDGYVQQYTLGELTTQNPQLGPEKSRNFTLGGVFQPIKPVSVSVDYYHITKSRIIGGVNPTAALNAYFAGQPIPSGYTVTADNPDPAFPNALARPVIVSGPYLNQSSETTSGIDVDLKARFRPIQGVQYVSELNYTHIADFKLIVPGQPEQSYVGTEGPYNLSSGAGTPRNRASFANTIIIGKTTVTGTLYYTDGFYMYGADVAPYGVCLYPWANGTCRVDSFWDFDLTGSYQLTKSIQLFGDIKNLFDTKPPIDPANYAGINYNPTYAQAGIIGRFFEGGIKVKF
jgi:iron complex outermembrane recepter protein